MAKETVLLFIITVLMIMPGTGYSGSMIQTTQRIVVIDPGHGGPYSGISTSGGVQEKTIALQLALKTAEKLETHYNVILTRTEDTNISAQERMFIANKNAADLFLSIHLHNSKEPSCFLYYFDPSQTDKQQTPALENTWKVKPLFFQPESIKAVHSFLSIFSAYKPTPRFFSTGAPVIFLEGATMPAVLIEPFSLSILPHNPDEIGIILDEVAELIEKSIGHYFEK